MDKIYQEQIEMSFLSIDSNDALFFPFCIKNWNMLNDSIKYLPSLTRFKKELRRFVRPKGNTFYGIRDKFGIKLLTKIRVSLSGDHRFHHNVNCVGPTCSCGMDDETLLHYFLCCPRYTMLRTTYLLSAPPNDHLIQTLM